MSKTIVFKKSTGLNDWDFYEEEFEFDEDVTDEEITDEYVSWILEDVSDNYTWYEKGDE